MLEPGKTGSGSGEFTDADLTAILQSLRAPQNAALEIEPRAGFYGRVMARIESEQKRSIWSVFLEPVFGPRFALASAALMGLLAVALLTTPPSQAGEESASTQTLAFAEPLVITEDGQPVDSQQLHPQLHQMNVHEGRGAVLVDLASYQGH